MKIIHLKQSYMADDKSKLRDKDIIDIVQSQYGIVKYVNDKKSEGISFPVLFESEKVNIDTNSIKNYSLCEYVRNEYKDVNTPLESLNEVQINILLQLGSKGIFTCFSLLSKLYASSNEEHAKVIKNRQSKTDAENESDLYRAMETIHPGFRNLPEEAQLSLFESSKDQVIRIIAGDNLLLDRELTALGKAEIAAKDFYGNNDPDNIVAIVFGELHDFSIACKQQGCAELTAVTFKDGQAYEQVVISGAVTEFVSLVPISI